ncbi:hypothetical protein LTR37_014379 [Vermiconidia calcicola]|uniref:Uncharacterized protein n=1 Tax=Vermiconidia calcicola TaxID=1690605 RepID=A0ACC3MUW8_9PEZI|nr:hypothetical protein LTR37_014379 [Vermiconidia calcicola]
MWLLNARTRKLEGFIGEGVPMYAILSHTWETDEVSFHDINHNANAETKLGYQKIRWTCAQALEDGLNYAWVDTCCIDKSSSAELSEAINSMWRWYRSSSKCYAFLSDVLVKCSGALSNGQSENCPFKTTPAEREFRKSRWFTRGWTLQELIAPPDVTFYGEGWCRLGSRRGELLNDIVDITKIPSEILTEEGPLPFYSVAQRMSWAAMRTTTRVEDEAYSLLGMFQVNMPLLYGEGRKAFRRLQEVIIKQSTDHSIFVWGLGEDQVFDRSKREHELLSQSAYYFDRCGSIECTLHLNSTAELARTPYALTNCGLQITLPIMKERLREHKKPGGSLRQEITAVLNCASDGMVAVLHLFRPRGAYMYRLFGMSFLDPGKDAKHHDRIPPV